MHDEAPDRTPADIERDYRLARAQFDQSMVGAIAASIFFGPVLDIVAIPILIGLLLVYGVVCLLFIRWLRSRRDEDLRIAIGSAGPVGFARGGLASRNDIDG